VLGPVFKTVEAGVPRLAGSIPVRLRYQRQCLFGSLPPAPRETRRRAWLSISTVRAGTRRSVVRPADLERLRPPGKVVSKAGDLHEPAEPAISFGAGAVSAALNQLSARASARS
jgi:hypothetical protein